MNKAPEKLPGPKLRKGSSSKHPHFFSGETSWDHPHLGSNRNLRPGMNLSLELSPRARAALPSEQVTRLFLAVSYRDRVKVYRGIFILFFFLLLSSSLLLWLLYIYIFKSYDIVEMLYCLRLYKIQTSSIQKLPTFWMVNHFGSFLFSWSPSLLTPCFLQLPRCWFLTTRQPFCPFGTAFCSAMAPYLCLGPTPSHGRPTKPGTGAFFCCPPSKWWRLKFGIHLKSLNVVADWKGIFLNRCLMVGCSYIVNLADNYVVFATCSCFRALNVIRGSIRECHEEFHSES